ncbi:hypothetical protein HY620_02105 [Candidatus Uhrbacteria bacterium]|nr:hypothetical protein [Candidatus Uhrbacteria bacterium]
MINIASTRWKRLLGAIFVFALIFFNFNQKSILFAQSMSSTSYIIQSSSVNCGGNTSATSSYALFDSVCETVSTTSTSPTTIPTMLSSSYAIDDGFQTMKDIPHISLTLSASSIALGTLSTASVASSSITTTVKTNASTGYSSTVIADGAFRTSKGGEMINTDGGITAGDGEYGFTTSGSDGQYNSSDTCIPYSSASTCTTVAKIYASNTLPANSTTTFTLKAARATTTPAGNYSQTITLITTGTF